MKFESAHFSMAGTLPDVPTPNVKAGQQSYQGYVKQVGAAKDQALARSDRGTANLDLLQARSQGSTYATVRDLLATTPDMAAAKAAYLRVGITEDYSLMALNLDGTLNVEATQAAFDLASRIEVLPNYTEFGYSQVDSLRSNSEALALQILTTGAMCMELVLDKSRLPLKFSPIDTTTMKFYPDGDGLSPVQVVGGQEVSLDYPTVFYVSLDQDISTAYSSSPFEPAIQPTLADAEFTQDLRRSLKRSFLPRLMAKLKLDSVMKMLPLEAQGDSEATAKFLEAQRADVENLINGLAPEDALVAYDSIEFDYISGKTGEAPATIKAVQEILNSKVASGARSLPSILGHGAGTQNIASSETLLFMKSADGTIRLKLNEIYSKGFTLALRLLGYPVTVQFKYNPIELRPESELEAFYQTRQSRIMDQLSLGWISDEMACLKATGRLPNGTLQKLSGSMFRHQTNTQAAGGADPANPYSNTSTGSNNGGGAATAARQPKTPANSRGSKVN